MDRDADDYLNVYLREAARRPDRVFFEFESHTDKPNLLSGAALHAQATAIGCRLQSEFSPQSRVLLAFSQGPEFVSALLGCFYANVVAIPVGLGTQDSTQRQVDVLESLARDAHASCILTHGVFSTDVKLDDISKRIENLPILPFNLILDTRHPEQRPRPRMGSDLALILYTSGSITSPKGIELSHDTIVAQSANGAKQWQIDANSRVVSWLPQFHNFGLHFGVLAPLLSGAKSVVLSPSVFARSPGEWMYALHRHQATHTAAPNFAFDECCSMIGMETMRHVSLASVRAVVCGGEPVQHETYLAFVKKFSALKFDANAFCPHYGLSEIGSVTTSTPGVGARQMNLDSHALEQGIVRPAVSGRRSRVILSCGKVSPDLQLVIYDETTRKPAQPDKLGEIWIASVTTAEGYLNQRRETGRVFRARLPNEKNGPRYFRTGDVGFVADGQLYVVGRKKNVMIVRGKNHHPADIEATIKHTLSQQHCATAVFACDTNGKDRVIAIQEIEASLTEEAYAEIVRKILSTVSEHHGLELHEINLVAKGSIARSGSGKIQRRPCKDLYLRGQLSCYFRFVQDNSTFIDQQNIPTEAPAERSNLLASLTKLLMQANLLTNSDVDHRRDSFKDLGLSSLQGIRLAGQIEKTFGIRFSPVLLYKYESIEELATYIESINASHLNESEAEATTRQRLHSSHAVERRSDVAVIGMSCVLPGANTVEQFWKNMIDGRTSVTEMPPSRLKILSEVSGIDEQHLVKLFPQWGGFVDNVDKFDARFFGINRMEAEAMDPQQRKLLELTWQVIESAGYDPYRLGTQQIGVYVGVHNIDYADMAANRLSVAQRYGAYLDSGMHASMLANRVSKWFDFHGPSEVINTACSSSLVALDHAVEGLLRNNCNMAIASGINLILSPRVYIASNQAGMLAPDGRCKTFSSDANGFVRSEGYGAVLLKALEDAERDGDYIWGVIKGTSVNHDGRSNSLRAPNLKAQKHLVMTAYQKARVPMTTIGYIETHGTGTKIGDPIETQALVEAFRELDPTLVPSSCGLGTVKTNIGHCESAAGIAGLIKALLSMHHGVIPGIKNFEKLNPLITFNDSPFYVAENNRKWERVKLANGSEAPRRAGISSFGFGGVNAHAVVEEYQMAIKSNQDRSSIGVLILLSARDENRLREQMLQLLTAIRNKPFTDADLPNIGFTLQIGRTAFKQRVAFLVHSIDDLVNKLTRQLANEPAIEHVCYGRVEEDSSPLSIDRDKFPLQAVTKDQVEEVMKHWVKGMEFNWEKILPGNHRLHRMSLPTYPFALDQYWIEKDVCAH